jgi:hypothetical protein
VIWWAWVNLGEFMMKDDFIQQNDITYIDRKHKEGIGGCMPTPPS